jgi:uncharacterized protein (TIGR02145 family)
MKIQIFFYNILLLFASTLYAQVQKDTVLDIDGNVYHTVKIGTQVWMVENLKVTHFRNGDSISNIKDYFKWNEITSSAYCNYRNDAKNAKIYGRLYNWYTVVDTRRICPAGWHVPDYNEWLTLINYLGGLDSAGGKMKETGNTHWAPPFISFNTSGATNESGFTALPGGHRYYVPDSSFAQQVVQAFDQLKTHAYFWSSSAEGSAKIPWGYFINSDGPDIKGSNYMMTMGLSIRCLKD